MMISYRGLTKLKTKQIVFQQVLLASDPATLEHLKELSCKRKLIEESINENGFITEAVAREMSGGLTSCCEQDIQKLEIYLPLLENLVRHLNTRVEDQKIVSWIKVLKIRWSSVLSSSSLFHLKGPKFYQVNDINFELGMTLFLYGAMLRERAFVVLSSDLVQSTTFFRKAAGVYNYLARVVLVCLIPGEDRSPEASPRMSSVMTLICLAEAQAVTARKAEENGKSGGLIAKLHYGVAEFLVEAIDMLRIITKECKDVSSRLLDYIMSCKTLHELKCYKHIAEVLTGDGKKEGITKDRQFGAAIGVLRRALSNAKKNMPKEESWRSVMKQVVDDLIVLLKKYERENEFIWHEKVPSDYELPPPQSVKIVNLIPYQPQACEHEFVFKL